MFEKTTEARATDRIMHSDFNPRKSRHSRESGNPGKNWIPGQARNDKPDKNCVVMYDSTIGGGGFPAKNPPTLLMEERWGDCI
jgi:hypothetical protein